MYTKVTGRDIAKRYVDLSIGSFFVFENGYDNVYQKCYIGFQNLPCLDITIAVDVSNGNAYKVPQPDKSVIECKLTGVDNKGVAIFTYVQ